MFTLKSLLFGSAVVLGAVPSAAVLGRGARWRAELRHEAEAPLIERVCHVSDRCVSLGSRENGRDEHAFHTALGKRQRWTRSRRKWLTIG